MEERSHGEVEEHLGPDLGARLRPAGPEQAVTLLLQPVEHGLLVVAHQRGDVLEGQLAAAGAGDHLAEAGVRVEELSQHVDEAGLERAHRRWVSRPPESGQPWRSSKRQRGDIGYLGAR